MSRSADKYFMDVAQLASQRSTCLRRCVGAVIVVDGQQVAAGYNGAPTGVSHCSTCMRDSLDIPSGSKHEVCRGIHAEENAIIQAAKHGHKVVGASIYCNTRPCFPCVKTIINSGIAEVVYLSDYPLAASVSDEYGGMVEESGIVIRRMPCQS